MSHGPTWDFVPSKHNFIYTAEVVWPKIINTDQIDWINNFTCVEDWLVDYIGSKYQRWAWNMATDCYNLSVAFKYDKHRTLFLIHYS
jgi:hypothetical protein